MPLLVPMLLLLRPDVVPVPDCGGALRRYTVSDEAADDGTGLFEEAADEAGDADANVSSPPRLASRTNLGWRGDAFDALVPVVLLESKDLTWMLVRTWRAGAVLSPFALLAGVEAGAGAGAGAGPRLLLLWSRPCLLSSHARSALDTPLLAESRPCGRTKLPSRSRSAMPSTGGASRPLGALGV